MATMKCDHCGKPFPRLHTVDLVIDRDYANLGGKLELCVDCLDKFLESAKTPPAPATTT